MASLDSSPAMVAAVRTTMALPIVVLAIPAGVLADRVDRRKLLLLTQWILLSTTSTLAALTYSGLTTAWGLLALTFVIGLGMVLHVPTWQASVPELVPRAQLPRAVALGSISFNLARAAGPAVGGLLIALAGVWVAFAINALSFAGVIAVVLCWDREETESSRGLSFRISLFQGVRYVFHRRTMRHVLLGVMLFVVPASSLWALLPLVAKSRLQWGAEGFGMLIGFVGIGAVIAASTLPRVQGRLGLDRTVASTMLVFAVGLGIMSQATSGLLLVPASVIMGGGWMMTLTTLNATAQVNLPRRIRARGMGCYLTAMALSMSAGSFLWGQVADWTSVGAAQTIAAISLVAAAAISLAFALESPSSHIST